MPVLSRPSAFCRWHSKCLFLFNPLSSYDCNARSPALLIPQSANCIPLASKFVLHRGSPMGMQLQNDVQNCIVSIILFAFITQALGVSQSGLHSSPCITSDFQRGPASPNLDLISSTGSVEQVHISMVGKNRVSVGWVTPRYTRGAVARSLLRHGQPSKLLQNNQVIVQSSACTSERAGSVVEYGTNEDLRHSSRSKGSYTCYSTRDYDSGLLHSATIGPLKPSTTYYYSCSDPERGFRSEVFSFTTPPSQESEDTFPFRLGFLGDMGQTQHSLVTMQRLIANKPGMVIYAGDLSYADGEQARWDSWGRLIEPLYANTLMQVIEGNHELEYYDMVPSPDHDLLAKRRGGLHVDSQFVAYEMRFFAESLNSGGASPLFYSYDVAGAHVIMMGSYAPFDQDSEQYTWLEHDLQSVDRGQTPWVIAAMHAPWMNSNTAHQGEGEAMRQALEQLLYTYRVDLVFSGHVHAYERTARVYDNKLDPCGPMHIVVGDGGNREGLAGGWLEPQPEWSLFRESSYGHGILDLLNATHAMWRWDRGEEGEAGEEGTGADAVMVVRPGNC